jgi:hypothetical protein
MTRQVTDPGAEQAVISLAGSSGLVYV